MGFFDFLFRRKKNKKAIESIEQSDQSPDRAIESLNQSIESLDQSLNQVIQSPNQSPALAKKPSIELEKESLKLGIAAGYISKSLFHIEELLDKIDSQLPNKEWLTNELKMRLSVLEQKLDEHERKSQERLHILVNLLNTLREISPQLPSTLQKRLLPTIKQAELHLTPKMTQLLKTVKEYGEISYKQLATLLNITESSLRGLLSLTIARGAPLERFIKEGKGWVRYKESEESGDSIAQSIE